MTLSRYCVNLSLILVAGSLVLGLMHFPSRPLPSVQAMMSFFKPFITSSPNQPTSLDLLVATAGDLQRGLSSGQLTSVELVDACLAQIENHDGYFHAIISKPPRATLVEQAKKLDEERRNKAIRGKLHGIPILIKDNIATLPELRMGTTAGSFALAGSKPKSNAEIINRLIEAGVIIVGKANLSELSFFKGSKLDCGWSAIGGQTQSAYVRGGFRPDDTFAGHSNPAGSSSGSAVGVTAGYAPISIGTETEGSLIIPASRAALYTIKPTIPIISQEGIVPISGFCDSAGPMTKSVEDLANLMDVLVDRSQTRVPKDGYISAVTATWDGLKIGTLDPEAWTFWEVARKPAPGAEAQMKAQTTEAYEKLATLTSGFRGNVPLISDSALEVNGEGCLPQIFAYGFRREIEAYLTHVQDSKVHSLDELISFNIDNADTELPPRNPRQDFLERAASINMTSKEYDHLVEHARNVARGSGIDEVFREYDINIILGPAESAITQFAAAAGYPIATLPLGYLDFNGRPHGLAAIAVAHQEARLIQLQSAWEATFPARKTPPL
ncbi:amidase signature domain-containing protein [Usnea florida]